MKEIPLAFDMRELAASVSPEFDEPLYLKSKGEMADLIQWAAEKGRTSTTVVYNLAGTKVVSNVMLKLKESLESAGYTVSMSYRIDPSHFRFYVTWN